MKVEKLNNKIIVYNINKKEEKIEDMIKDILNDLNEYYKYQIKSSYDIKIYINKYYGKIIELNEIDISEDNVVKINVNILKDTLFLYEVEDPLDYLNEEIYYYDNKYYINIKKENIKLIENSKLIYGSLVYRIIGKGIKL